MPLKKKKLPSQLRAALFGDEKTFIPAIAPTLLAKNCQFFPVDISLSPTALRELKVDLCIIDLSEPALTAHTFMRRLPGDLPVIAVVNEGDRDFSFAEIFDVLTLSSGLERLGEDLDYLRSALRSSDPPPLPPNDGEIELFSEFISRHCGLHYDRRNRKNLERGIQKRMRIVAAPSVTAYLAYLEKFLESRQEFKKLVSLLTIGETSFFRFEPHFTALIEEVLPKLIKKNQATRRLHIWSAGCSTGEEVYSLAITLLRHFPHLADWDVTILGTDISHPSLATAREGTYRERTLRNVDPEQLAEWFVKSGADWSVTERLRRLTSFSFLNLQSETYPHPKNGTTECDLIFCRNVMIYFRPETVRAVVGRLRRALLPGGYLFLGHAETLGSGFLDFVRCQHQGGIYYRAGEEEDKENSAPRYQFRADVNRKQPQVLLFDNTYENNLLPRHNSLNEKEKSGIFSADQVNNKTVSQNSSPRESSADRSESSLLDEGFSIADQGRLGEALFLCQQVLQANDLSPRGYFLRGLIQAQQGQNLAAAEDFQRVILLDIKAIMAHYHLANAYRRLGRQTEALRSLRTVMRLLAKLGGHETIPDAKDWTVTGLLERCGTELKQLEK